MIAEKKKKRFPNLEAEMARKGVLKGDLADLLHKTNGVITSRMDGSSEWGFWEVVAIKRYLSYAGTLEDLFECVEMEQNCAD